MKLKQQSRHRSYLESVKSDPIRYEKYLEKRRKQYSDWYKCNLQYNKIRNKLYRLSHPDLDKEQWIRICSNPIRHTKHKLSKNKYHKIWRTNNPERWKKIAQANQAQRKSAGQKLSVFEIQKLYEENIKLFGTLTCCLCFEPINFGEDTLEHLLPIVRGGTNDVRNLDIAHRSCNCSKNYRTPSEYFCIKKNIEPLEAHLEKENGSGNH